MVTERFYLLLFCRIMRCVITDIQHTRSVFFLLGEGKLEEKKKEIYEYTKKPEGETNCRDESFPVSIFKEATPERK